MKTLNLGIVAHADAGKTTLTEQILYRAGAIRAAGSVDEGTASTDRMEIERKRGISVRAACASVVWKGTRLNLIDAPGHSDFLSEVERTLSVLDGAVLVVSAVEGVQPQTRMLIECFRKAKLPCVVFINKLDRAGSSWKVALRQAEEEFGVPLLPLSDPAGEGTDQVSLAPEYTVSQEFAERAVLACGDDGLLESFLDSGKAPAGLWDSLREKTGEGEIVPAVCGASKYGLGVTDLLDSICLLVPQPKPLGNTLCARVYKIEQDPVLGKAAYVRLFGGVLKNRQAVGEEKVTRLRLVRGRKLEDGEEAGPNDVAVIYGLSGLRAGDLLGEAMPGLRDYKLAEPLMLCRVIPEQPEQMSELTAALRQLEDEDPALRLEWNREKQEAWVRLTGTIQKEVLESLLEERWGLRAFFGEASVIYRETPVKAAEGFEGYWAPKPCWAVVKFLIEPLPRGSGFQYESRVSPDRLPYRYQAHVETAVPRALEQGLHGWQVTDLKVTLIDGESHHVHTHPLDFFVATPMGIMDGLKNAGTRLLEPVLKAEFSGPEKYLGKAVSLAVGCRGRFESPWVENGRFRLEAFLPAAEAVDLPVKFAAATGGEGVYNSSFSHYQDCPEGMGRDRERIGVDPLDKARFILAARSALTESMD